MLFDGEHVVWILLIGNTSGSDTLRMTLFDDMAKARLRVINASMYKWYCACYMHVYVYEYMHETCMIVWPPILLVQFCFIKLYTEIFTRAF